MTKQDLKVAFVDFWPEWDIENFITPILSEKYNVISGGSNPDVVFHSIFGGRREVSNYNCKKVLVLAENWRASKIGSHYSISFDPHSEWNFRLPLWQIYLLLWPEFKEDLFSRVRLEWDEFKEFAAFTVSNPSNNLRNSHFDRLHSFSPVKSYGKVRTNDLSLKRASAGRYWRDAKLEFFRNNPHKFMLAYENSSFPGYCTEKLMDSFLNSGRLS
jgi:hypothetical protein